MTRYNLQTPQDLYSMPNTPWLSHYTNDASWRVWYANIYVPKLKCQHEGETYILACHTSPSHVVCFVASLTKIWLNSIKHLHFTGMERYGNYRTSRHNYVTSQMWSHAHCSTNQHVPDLFTLTRHDWYVNKGGHDLIGCAKLASEISDYVTRHVTEFGPIAMQHFS